MRERVVDVLHLRHRGRWILIVKGVLPDAIPATVTVSDAGGTRELRMCGAEAVKGPCCPPDPAFQPEWGLLVDGPVELPADVTWR